MLNIPKYYPNESWWCGRTYIREAERLTQILHQHTMQPQVEGLIQRMAFENLYRGIRALFDLSPSTQGAPYFEDPDLLRQQIPDALQPFFHSFDESKNDLDLAIQQTKALFQQYFLDSCSEEYAFSSWDDDKEILSAILVKSQPGTADSLASLNLSAQLGEQPADQNLRSFEEAISASHNYFWNSEEYDLLPSLSPQGGFIG
jgi:hypothetical protein